MNHYTKRMIRRQQDKLRRESYSLAYEIERFTVLSESQGPFSDDARRILKKALRILDLSARIDGMREITEEDD